MEQYTFHIFVLISALLFLMLYITAPLYYSNDVLGLFTLFIIAIAALVAALVSIRIFRRYDKP